jgi:hypothetical protein
MSVLPSDIAIYGCASMPEADGQVTGGAIDFTKGIEFADITTNGTLSVVSSSASDTAVNMTYQVLDAFGILKSVSVTLNGTTAVAGSQTAQRIVAAAITGGAVGSITNPGGTAAVGDIALYASTAIISGHNCQAGSANSTGITPALVKLAAGDGASASVGQIIRITSGTGINQLRRIIDVTSYGTDIVAVNRDWGTIPDATSVYSLLNGMLFDIGPNPIKSRTRLFATSYSNALGAATNIFYEKIFIVNNNLSIALTPQGSNSGVGLSLISDTPALSSGVTLDIGIASSLNDSLTVVNRQTAPSGITFIVQPATIFIPNPGILAPGAVPNTSNCIALWLRYTLPAGAPPYQGFGTLQFTGTTV